MSGRGQYNHNQLSVDEYKCTHASRAKYTAATSKVELNTVRRKPKTLLQAMKRARLKQKSAKAKGLLFRHSLGVR